MFKLLHDSTRRAYLWGVHDTVSEAYKLGLKKVAKPKIVYDPSKYGELAKEVMDYLNDKAGTTYRHTTKKHINFIFDRAAEGFELGDFKKVIDRQCYFWLNDPKMVEYLRPATLFNETNFIEYVHGIGPAVKGVGDTGPDGTSQGANTTGATGKKVGGGTRKNNAFEKLERLNRSRATNIPE